MSDEKKLSSILAKEFNTCEAIEVKYEEKNKTVHKIHRHKNERDLRSFLEKTLKNVDDMVEVDIIGKKYSGELKKDKVIKGS